MNNYHFNDNYLAINHYHFYYNSLLQIQKTSPHRRPKHVCFTMILSNQHWYQWFLCVFDVCVLSYEFCNVCVYQINKTNAQQPGFSKMHFHKHSCKNLFFLFFLVRSCVFHTFQICIFGIFVFFGSCLFFLTNNRSGTKRQQLRSHRTGGEPKKPKNPKMYFGKVLKTQHRTKKNKTKQILETMFLKIRFVKTWL